MGRKVGAVVQLVPLSVGKLSPHLTRGGQAWAEAYLQSNPNRSIAIDDTKPVIAILVPKLVAMATSLSTSGPHLTHDSLVYPSPQPKRHLGRFSRFCIDDRKVSLYFTMERPFPLQNCPFP